MKTPTMRGQRRLETATKIHKRYSAELWHSEVTKHLFFFLPPLPGKHPSRDLVVIRVGQPYNPADLCSGDSTLSLFHILSDFAPPSRQALPSDVVLPDPADS